MKTLNLHCDYIKFKGLKPALKNIEEMAPGQKLEGESKDCLVVMVAIEKDDNTNESVEELVKNIKDIASQVKATNIVLYPYAHLSPSLSKPDFALETLEKADKELSKNKTYKVTRAPFGYYKEFELKCKGHPLSELSRSIGEKNSETKSSTVSKDEVIDLQKRLVDV